MNNISLFGRLTAEPELRTTDNGTKYARFLMAVDRRTQKDATDFIDCIAWNKLAEIITKYVHKGNQLSVIGSLETSSYEKNGEKRKSYVVNVREIDFVSQTKPADEPKASQETAEPTETAVTSEFEPSLPFDI